MFLADAVAGRAGIVLDDPEADATDILETHGFLKFTDSGDSHTASLYRFRSTASILPMGT